MSPEELTYQLIELESAAEIVEAIDSRRLQQQHGWDLSRWRYQPIPWGVRFIYHGPDEDNEVIIAVISRDRRPTSKGEWNLKETVVYL